MLTDSVLNSNYFVVIRYLTNEIVYNGGSVTRATEVMKPGTCYGTGESSVAAMSCCRHACREAKENHAKLPTIGLDRPKKLR